MTQAGKNYALALEGLNVPEQDVTESERLLAENPRLAEALANPLAAQAAKERVIGRVFPPSLHNFFKTLCAHGRAEEFPEIAREYRSLRQRQAGVLSAALLYVTEPSGEQRKGIEEFLKKTYGKSRISLEMREDKDLIGGFILQAEGEEYDWSLRGRLQRLEQTLIRR